MKKVILSIVSFFIASLLLTVHGQSNGPSNDHQKLKALVGRWTIQGMEDRYLEICEMYNGEYFLVCNSEFKSKSGKINTSVSIMGFSVIENHMTYYHYGSSGESQTLTGSADEEGNFYFEKEDLVEGKMTRTKIAMRKVGENFNFKEETSVDNGPWTTTTDMVYVRLN